MNPSTHFDPEVRERSNKLLREAGYALPADSEKPNPLAKFGAFICLFALLLAFVIAMAFDAHYTIKGLELDDPTTSVTISGTATLPKQTSGYLNVVRNGVLVLSCSLRVCGFPGIHEIADKEIEARLSGRYILAVKVDGREIDAKRLRTDSARRMLTGCLWLIGGGVIGLIVAVTGWRRCGREAPISTVPGTS